MIDIRNVFKRKVTQSDLYDAASKGDIEYIRRNKDKCEIQYGGYSVLNCAVLMGFENIVELLLTDKRFIISSKEYRVFFSAVSSGKAKMLVMLMNEQDIESDIIRDSLIEAAIKGYHKDVFELLINKDSRDIFNIKNNWLDKCFRHQFLQGLIFLLKHKDFNPTIAINKIIDILLLRNDVLTELILNNKKLAPEIKNNRLIIAMLENQRVDIAEILFKNNRVRDTLKVDNVVVYNELMKKMLSEKINDF